MRRDAEVLQVVELLRQAAEVADAVAVAVVEGADVDLVDDRVLVPERVVVESVSSSPLDARSRAVTGRRGVVVAARLRDRAPQTRRRGPAARAG